MLKYGPYPVLTIREIPQGRLFQDSSCSKVHHMVSGSQEWRSMSNQDHHGLQVVVNDLFPLLALEEAAEVYHHFGLDGLSLLPFVQFDSSRPLETSVMSFLGMSVSEGTVEEEGSDTPTGSLRLPPLSYLNGQEVTAEVKVVKTRETLGRTINIGSGMGRAATESGSDKVSPFQRPRSRVVSSPIVSRHSVIVNRTERGEMSKECGSCVGGERCVMGGVGRWGGWSGVGGLGRMEWGGWLVVGGLGEDGMGWVACGGGAWGGWSGVDSMERMEWCMWKGPKR